MEIDLGKELTVMEVGPMRERLLEALGEAEAIRVDGSAIEQVDGAALQLLASFVKTAGERSIEVSWAGVSQVLGDASQILGLEAVIPAAEAE